MLCKKTIPNLVVCRFFVTGEPTQSFLASVGSQSNLNKTTIIGFRPKSSTRGLKLRYHFLANGLRRKIIC